MRIGIDIDDTTFYTAQSMIKYADIFEEERTGMPVHKDNFGLIRDRYYLQKLYDWDNETKFAFFDKYYKNVLEECSMLPNANKVIKKLKDCGDIIHFVTARLMNINGCDTESITKNSLAKFDIPYDYLDLHISDKVKFFKENNIDLCIEDSYETCKEMVENGIRAILMTTKMNERIDSGNITRVYNWNELYNEIEKIRKESLNSSNKSL